ncbi:hypothetical protein MNBD_UNCLBAC01-1094 [hydrothermal vent metagenome]|uniref:O-antigen ligase-related domain-containing protein n=1 Tax=hydrothermal vent metagenome TaxID=652676 RepID=A0A3B1D295_9ZZZZ
MSFITLLLYIFCTIIRPQDWMPEFHGIRLINYLSIATAVFLIFEKLGAKKNIFIKVPQNKLMLGFFFAILMSHVAHFYFAGLTMAFTKFSVTLILFFLLLNGLNTEKKFKIAIWFMVGLVFILVFQGIYQFKNGYGWAGQSILIQGHGSISPTIRITWIGIFNDPNDLALMFVIASGIALAFSFSKSNFILRLISLTILGYLFYGIYLTNSRGGLLALMTTIFFYFVKKTKKFILGGIIGGGLAAGVFALGPSRLGLISTQEASANTRVNLWYEGVLMFKSSPLFGVGYRMFTDQLPQTAHNSYILAAAELGFFGLFFWMALIYSSFKGLSIIQNHDQQLRTYAVGLQSSLVGFCTAAFFLSRTYVILPYILFAFSGALMFVAQQKNKNLDFRFNKKDIKTTGLLSIGILLMVYGVIKLGL